MQLPSKTGSFISLAILVLSIPRMSFRSLLQGIAASALVVDFGNVALLMKLEPNEMLSLLALQRTHARRMKYVSSKSTNAIRRSLKVYFLIYFEDLFRCLNPEYLMKGNSARPVVEPKKQLDRLRQAQDLERKN